MSIQAPSLPTDTTLQPLGQEVEPTLVSLLESSCRRFAQRPAYHNLGTTLTYGELARIGVPDERSGQAVAIFVVLRPGQRLTESELLEYCRERLTAYKLPKRVEFRTSLPKTNVGKVLRRELKAA